MVEQQCGQNLQPPGGCRLVSEEVKTAKEILGVNFLEHGLM